LGVVYYLVLSSADENVQGTLVEERTYQTKSGVIFHLFTEEELKTYFNNFEILYFEHHKTSEHPIKACYTFVVRKS
jgi:hypothetical protein